MVNLNALRAHLSCASHHESETATHVSHVMPQHGMATSDAHAKSMSEGECATPARSDCCSALITCSLLLGLGNDRSGVVVVTFHDVVASAVEALPLSRVTGPEPPPPRA